MAVSRRAYTSEYNFSAIPEKAPERVRRTRQRPQINKQTKQPKQEELLTPAVLRTLIAAVVMISFIFIGLVVINAHSAKLQYSINQLKNQNTLLENEISTLQVKVERETGIERLEAYAINELGMVYPAGSQCIHLSSMEVGEESLSQLIKEKVYE